jgi:putative SOS response-associated peptidase YedK
MCGRYVISVTGDVLAEVFGLTQTVAFEPRWNLAPTQSAPVVVQGADGARRLTKMRWGLVPSWADDPSIGSRMINARSETAAEKPSFRRAFRSRRCIVPADGFYEWQAVPGARKRPHVFRRADGGVLAIAGLWESWAPRDGGSALETYAILTTAANDVVRPVHERMPVLLQQDGWRQWLDPGTSDVERLKSYLVPAPSANLVAHPVGDTVNDPRRDVPACATPLPR